MGKYLVSLCFLAAVFRQSSASGQVGASTDVPPTVNSEYIEWIDDGSDLVVTTFQVSTEVRLRYTVSGHGIKITSLQLCDRSDCLGFSAELLDANGCQSGTTDYTPATGFVRVSANTYETGAFTSSRFSTIDQVYLLGVKEICEVGGAACDDICTATTGRRKRDTWATNGTTSLGSKRTIVLGERVNVKSEKPKEIVETKRILIDINNIPPPEESCFEDTYALPSVAVMGSMTGVACAMAGFLTFQVQAAKKRRFSLKA